VATDASGNVYVTDDAHRVQYFDAAGGYLLSWGMAGTGPGQFSYPGGVAVDSAGNVYVSDYDTDTIQKFG